MIFRAKPFILFILSIVALAGCRIDGTITYQEQGVEGIEVDLSGPESGTTATYSNGELSFIPNPKSDFIENPFPFFNPLNKHFAIKQRHPLSIESFRFCRRDAGEGEERGCAVKTDESAVPN